MVNPSALVPDDLYAKLRQQQRHAAGWQETAEQNLRDAFFYRGLVEECGKTIGHDAYIADDGSIQDSVLCAKVPELVKSMSERLRAAEAKVGAVREYITGLDKKPHAELFACNVAAELESALATTGQGSVLTPPPAAGK